MTWMRKPVKGTGPSRPVMVSVVMLAVIGSWAARGEDLAASGKGVRQAQSSQLIQAVRGCDRAALLELLQVR